MITRGSSYVYIVNTTVYNAKLNQNLKGIYKAFLSNNYMTLKTRHN